MVEDIWRDDLEFAQRVVREGLMHLKDSNGPVAKTIEGLCAFSQEEAKELAGFGDRIEAYFKLENPERPLCLGVFGPPGSGKSFAARQVLADRKLELQLFNLSQMHNPKELSLRLAGVASKKNLVVFFDEFDSRLDGTPLGWLQWLLAPMQDGTVSLAGESIDLKRAVFVFAGGTADSFEEFPGVHEECFRGAKGPDFISRLRGHINIRGVNDWPYRSVRRSMILRSTLERIASHLLGSNGYIPEEGMQGDLVRQILGVGRFRHGARSVEALVEMSTTPDSPQFSVPPLETRTSHVDLGPLSDHVIALSAGGTEKDYDNRLVDVWPTVAGRLLELGAALIYGGGEQKGFTERLVEMRLPQPLGTDEKINHDLLARPRSSRVTWLRRETGPPRNESWHERVDVRQLPGLSKEESEDLSGTDGRLGTALSLFRMRAIAARLADAHLVFGGKVSGSSGRFPGIAEEVMLGLAAGNAIYVCGGFGGAAHAVGQVLGLDQPWALTPSCLRRESHGPGAAPLEALVRHWGFLFQMAHRSDLPLSYEDLVAFLRIHALEGPKWLDNGLTADENRTLFRATEAQEIVRLVTKGLSRRGAPA